MESREGVVMGNENARIELDFSVGKQGEKGNDGKSAYQIAVENGFQGSEAEWIESFMRVDPNTINITTEKIISLRDTNKLIPSQTYRVTDYVSHYDEFEIESAKHPYDLIVTSSSLNSFFEDAKAVLHEGDDYFANSDLSKWQLKINNDLKVIWLKDEFNNEAPYDFKNVLFSVLYGDEMLSLYTFSIDGNDYSLNPTAESLIGSEIEIVHTIGMCENNVIKGCSIPEGFQGVCVISQSTYAIDNEMLTGIENNRINLDKETNFIILNSWGTASNNNVNIDNGSYVYIPQVRGFDENVIRGLVTIDCIPYTLEQHYDLLGTFSSNIITNSKIKNKGSHNFYENSVCETEYHNLNIQLDNCKIVSCTWRINITIEGVYQVHLFDSLTAINSYFDLNYRSNPDMPTVGEVFQKPGGDWWVGDKVQWYLENNEPIRVTEAEFQELVDNSQLVPGQQYRIIDYTLKTNENTLIRPAGHYFDIIVTASLPNNIELKAKAEHHEGDTYFANNKLNLWELEVRLTKDFLYPDGYDNPIVITFMKDEFYNEVNYDFKNSQYTVTLDNIEYLFYTFTGEGLVDLSVNGKALYNKLNSNELFSTNIMLFYSTNNNISYNRIDGMSHVLFIMGKTIQNNTVRNSSLITIFCYGYVRYNIIDLTVVQATQDIDFSRNVFRTNIETLDAGLKGVFNRAVIENNALNAKSKSTFNVINSTIKGNRLAIYPNNNGGHLLNITDSVVENSDIVCQKYQIPAELKNSNINGTTLKIESTCTIDGCVAPPNSHIIKTDDTTLKGKIFMLTPPGDSNPQYYAATSDADFYNYMKSLETTNQSE